jgi:methyl-accepting chemotaxis protein
VTATQDLRRRVAAPGDDELARLARSFNTMLEALAHSRQASVSSSPTRRTSCARR